MSCLWNNIDLEGNKKIMAEGKKYEEVNIMKVIFILQKELNKLNYRIDLLESFIFLDNKGLKDLYETYKKLEQGTGSDTDK